MEKIFVRCHYCNKKLRIRKEIGPRAVYYVEGGIAKVIGNRIVFYCNNDSSIIDL
ncbi:MAG: hypothetical protein ACTSYZ_13975 [Candidatus Helarchaeota archaeon]